MRSVAELESYMESSKLNVDPVLLAAEYLKTGEEILEHWVLAREQKPTDDKKESFRILALHRQGSKGEPSFNACRETCREIAYYYNLITMQPQHKDIQSRIAMMEMVAKHLVLFVGNKMMDEKVGEFCCSAKVNRLNSEELKARVGVE